MKQHATDPFLRSCWVAVALAAGGFLAFGLGWRGAAGARQVWEQVPFLVSGGLAGFGLLAAGLGIVTVQVNRRLAARKRWWLERVLDDFDALTSDRDADVSSG